MMLPKNRMRRVQRSAASITGGEQLLEWLLTRDVQRLLIKGADEGLPPVSLLSEQLKKFAKQSDVDIDLRAMSVRQFIGATVRAILESKGYIVVEKGVRIPPGNVFRTGSVYRKADPQAVGGHRSWVARMIETMTPEEATEALTLLKAKGFR